MKYFLLVSICVFTTVANAQSRYYPPPSQDATARCRDGSEPLLILQKDSYKIKAVSSVSSGTARVADYVEFKTMEPIYSVARDYPDILFDKDTPIYAVVTRRHSRHFPLVRGKLEIALEPLLTWDNRRIEMAISRYGRLTGTETRFANQRDIDKRNKGINKPCKIDAANCVAGRGDATVSVVVTAIAGAAGAAVSSIADDDDTKFIAATSFFSIAKDLGELLNGTDVGISKDEIFNLRLKPGTAVCPVPIRKSGPAK